MNESGSFIKAEEHVAELTFRSVVLAVCLTVILAMSNTYLALKLGILSSASIPAAIVSMGILRLFKKPSILENNAVQTAASAGEAVAGGIVYTIPALIIIEYWHQFDYLTNVMIALIGGVLGVLFSIPLRRILVNEPLLRFPEGRAIAEVLKSSAQGARVREIFLGGAIGAFLELFQLGFKVIASSVSYWFVYRGSLFGFGAGFSATMIGAGYLVGAEMAISIFIGALVSWFFAMPIASQFYPEYLHHETANQAATYLWQAEMRYLGIGAMLFAGIWTFIQLARPLIKSIQVTARDFKEITLKNKSLRTDLDIPSRYIIAGIAVMAIALFYLFQSIFPAETLALHGSLQVWVSLSAVFYVLVVGFLFSVITAYFSGMVGVTASPGSSVVIAGMLFAAWLLLKLIHHVLPLPFTATQIQAAEAMTIIIGGIVTGVAAIANDNTQDLKVGFLVGATPWKQQLMLLLGVVVSALVIPPVMQLLFDVYGIAGVLPHAGMDPSKTLPAPAAAMMAAITQAVFNHEMPWLMMGIGAGLIICFLFLVKVFRLNRLMRFSMLGIAIGMYLPLESTVPLFLGGMISWFVQRRINLQILPKQQVPYQQKGVLIACGLVAGSALMDVLLAIPFSLGHSSEVLSLVGVSWAPYSVVLAVISLVMLSQWINQRVLRG